MSQSPIRRLLPNDPALSEGLALLRASFSFMTGRIDPPSSMDHFTLQDLSLKAQGSWVLVVGNPVMACVVASPLAHSLYIGKIAVDPRLRGQGVARDLVGFCEKIAGNLGLDRLELQVRIELVENQLVFTRLGFVKTVEGSHPGYTQITEITMQKILATTKLT